MNTPDKKPKPAAPKAPYKPRMNVNRKIPHNIEYMEPQIYDDPRTWEVKIGEPLSLKEYFKK